MSIKKTQNLKETKNYSDLKKKLLSNGVFDRKYYKREKSKHVSELLERTRKNEIKDI